MKKPKILFVFHNPDFRSGASRSLMDIVDHLIETEKYDIQAVLPYPGGSGVDYLKGKGIMTYTYRYGDLIQSIHDPFIRKVFKFPVYLFRHLRVCMEANRAAADLRENHFDLVYSNTSTIIFGGLLGQKLNAKMIWHIREFGILDHQIRFYLGQKWMEQFINRNADAVLCVSQAVLDHHARFIDRSKMAVTYNSYSKDFISPKHEFNVSKPLNILLAGDVKPSKGQLEAVQAMAIVLQKRPNQAVLHLAGRAGIAAYSTEIERCIRTNGMEENVLLYGQVLKMKELRSSMDVGLVASTNEAFGRTAIEGMLSMMCMIGRNTGGTVEQIDHMRTGLLYDGSVADLADKIIYLIDHRDKLKEMAENGFYESVELHTKGRCAKIAEKAIDKCLGNRPS